MRRAARSGPRAPKDCDPPPPRGPGEKVLNFATIRVRLRGRSWAVRARDPDPPYRSGAFRPLPPRVRATAASAARQLAGDPVVFLPESDGAAGRYSPFRHFTNRQTGRLGRGVVGRGKDH